MRIHDEKRLADLNSYLGAAKDNAVKNKPQEPAESDRDKINISHSSREIQKIREKIDSVPDVREAKVKEIRESIQNGTYNVKGEAIAAGVVKKSLIDAVL